MKTRREINRTLAALGLLAALPPAAARGQQQPAILPQPVRRLGPLRAVTTTAADLGAVEAAYTTHLGYRVVERSKVSREQARSWGAPAVAGRAALVLMPASREPTYLRFVEQPVPDNYQPLTSYGWNATEIVVENSDLLAERLRGSPFKILAEPHPLTSTPDIHAMQVLGPAREVLYLTWIKRPLPGRDLPMAQSFVGRCFIAVVGGPDIEAMLRFYQTTFGNLPGPVHKARIRTLSAANGLGSDSQHDLATIQLGGGTKIEVDQYPSMTTRRAVADGALPPGMAIVTFACPDLDLFRDRCLTAPIRAGLPPGRRTRSATLVGAAGELIELVDLV